MRGSRVQAVSNEIAGERVDIIPFDENPAQFVINAMAPAEVVSIVVDEDSHSMDIAVTEEKLSQAIGRGGQNIRLASELTGWELNVMTEQAAEAKSEGESQQLVDMFKTQLDVDEDVAQILVQEGFSTIEEIAYVPASELNGIEEFDEEIVKELRNRARDVLLTQAIASEEKIDGAEPAEDLLQVDGMDEEARVAAGEPRHRDARGSRRAGDRRSARDRGRRCRARRRADHGGAQALVRIRGPAGLRTYEIVHIVDYRRCNGSKDELVQRGADVRRCGTGSAGGAAGGPFMADVTVSQFAEVLKVPVERLLTQLDEAGIQVSGADDTISDEAKMELLTFLRRAHGRTEDSAAPRKITLKRKSQGEIKVASAQGRARMVNVEVRRKKTYLNRSVLEEQARVQHEEQDRAEARARGRGSARGSAPRAGAA